MWKHMKNNAKFHCIYIFQYHRKLTFERYAFMSFFQGIGMVPEHKPTPSRNLEILGLVTDTPVKYKSDMKHVRYCFVRLRFHMWLYRKTSLLIEQMHMFQWWHFVRYVDGMLGRRYAPLATPHVRSKIWSANNTTIDTEATVRWEMEKIIPFH